MVVQIYRLSMWGSGKGMESLKQDWLSSKTLSQKMKIGM